MNDVCFELSEINVGEERCSSHFYSDDLLMELDGHVYAENCRELNGRRRTSSVLRLSLPLSGDSKRCHADCGLGQECQWIDGEEMCVCSPDSCLSADRDDRPVCASNNMTFASSCAMAAWKCLQQQSALYTKYDGECQSESDATERVATATLALLEDCRNVKCPEETVCTLVKNTGEPMCYPKRHCHPSRNSEPVCGTDGVTYPNSCVMRLNVNPIGRTPELAHRGRCGERRTSSSSSSSSFVV